MQTVEGNCLLRRVGHLGTIGFTIDIKISLYCKVVFQIDCRPFGNTAQAPICLSGKVALQLRSDLLSMTNERMRGLTNRQSKLRCGAVELGLAQPAIP
jgi:hypothetical protein